jgi:hypothetical protein
MGSSALVVKNGWPEAWYSFGAGLSKQVSYLGNKTYASSTVSHLEIEEPGLSITKDITVHQVIQISKKKAFNELVLIGEIKEGLETKFQEFRSPGLQTTKDLFFKWFSVDLDSSSTVLGTAALESKTEAATSSNAILYSKITNSFAFDVVYSLAVAAVGAERIILEQATKSVFEMDVLAVKTRSHVYRLNDWLSVPSSDSTQLLQGMVDLRNSLNLDLRTQQVLRTLGNRIKSIDFALAAFIGTFGIASSLGAQRLLPGSFESFETWVQLAVALILSGTVSILTFLLIRRS